MGRAKKNRTGVETPVRFKSVPYENLVETMAIILYLQV